MVISKADENEAGNRVRVPMSKKLNGYEVINRPKAER